MDTNQQSDQLFAFPPEGAMIGIFDNEVFLQEALPDIQRLSVSGIYQLQGEELRQRGAGANLERAIGESEAPSDEIGQRQRSIDQLVDAARDDQHILIVHLADPEQAIMVRQTLMRHHAHLVRHFEHGAASA